MTKLIHFTASSQAYTTQPLKKNDNINVRCVKNTQHATNKPTTNENNCKIRSLRVIISVSKVNNRPQPTQTMNYWNIFLFSFVKLTFKRRHHDGKLPRHHLGVKCKRRIQRKRQNDEFWHVRRIRQACTPQHNTVQFAHFWLVCVNNVRFSRKECLCFRSFGGGKKSTKCRRKSQALHTFTLSLPFSTFSSYVSLLSLFSFLPRRVLKWWRSGQIQGLKKVGENEWDGKWNLLSK